ncbi:S41 family peptidase [Candidatus Kaiserbacteria bacterium]|nr:S41 family peptidase [Candidatus Kaiserbacteria bacterium]
MDDTPKFGTGAIIAASLILFAVGFVVGDTVHFRLAGMQGPAFTEGTVPDGADLTPFFKAWNILDKNFVSATSTATTTPEEKVWGAINGLAATFGDPYTVFFPPQEKSIFDSQVAGDFSGVGMEIGIRDGLLVVIAPLKDTPAYRGGVQSGDVVLKIDGKDTAGMAVDDAVAMIRGKEGTTVSLQLSRKQGNPFEIKLVRETITLPTVDTTLRSDRVFVIHVYTFNSLAPAKFRDALREFAHAGSDKLVIDLRGDPGGYLEAAVDMASWFLPVGDIIVTEDFGAKEPPDVQRSRGYDIFENVKIAILIDKGSASASEIFAGALHDHGKATLVGETSFGKGSVQQVFDITNNTSLKVTIARWLTPSGVSISHAGIDPDIKASITEEDVKAGRDPQLDRAVEFLLTGK